MKRTLVVVILLRSVVASGQPTEQAPPRQWANLRVGGSGDAFGAREELCLEMSPIRAASIEGCGTGSGFLHRDDVPELGHFRAKWRLTSWALSWAWLEPQVGLGFVELQTSADSPGFHFFGTDEAGVETSGPEATAALRTVRALSSGWELVGNVSASVAWLPHAGELARPQAPVQPSIAISVGAGF